MLGSQESPTAARARPLASNDGLGLLEEGRKQVQDHVKLPSKVQVMNEVGEVMEVTISSATKVVACCGCPAPPGGWYGPFGFFRLMSYLFVGVIALGLVLTLIALQEGDGFGSFAGVLLMAAAFICALASYAHEDLANQVTEMSKQNDLYAAKTTKLSAQIKQLGGVTDRLQNIEKEMGISMDQLEKTLNALHQQTSVAQLAAMLRAFTDADGDGDRNQRLTKDEVEDFFDSSNAILKGACPTFDFEGLKKEATEVGLGLYAVRFLVNALCASGDEVPSRSTAELSLLMFAMNPEGAFHDCLNDMKLALVGTPEDEIKGWLEAKKKLARADEGGRIPCKELHDLSMKIMTYEPNSPTSRGGGGSPKPEPAS